MGAMGLTTGILDSEALADTLELIIHEGKTLGTLNTYSDERRMVFQTFVDPMSTQNKLLCASDVETAQEDWYIRLMAKATPEKMKEGTKPFFGVWRTNMRQSTLSQEMCELCCWVNVGCWLLVLAPIASPNIACHESQLWIL